MRELNRYDLELIGFLACIFLSIPLFYAIMLVSQPKEIEEANGLTQGKIVLTFDDCRPAYKNDYAFQVLSEYNVSGVVFCEAYKIKGSYGSYNWDALLENGWEIGGHSWTHPYLTSLSASRLQNETVLAKRFLEDYFNTSIVSFAYPYSAGAQNATVLKSLRDSGYLFARSDNWDVPQLWDGNKSLQIHSYIMSHSNYAARLESAIAQAKKGVSGVLMFHGVNSGEGWGYVTPSDMRTILARLRDSGVHTTTFKDLLPVPPEPEPQPEPEPEKPLTLEEWEQFWAWLKNNEPIWPLEERLEEWRN